MLNGNAVSQSLARVPDLGSVSPSEWRELEVTGYERVWWTHGRAPNLVCNGFNIGSSASSLGYSRTMRWEGANSHRFDFITPVRVPSVSIVDRGGRLPIDLQRFSLRDHRYPFADELMNDVVRDYVAFCYVFGPDRIPSTKADWANLIAYPGLTQDPPASFRPAADWIFMKGGAGSLHAHHLDRCKLRKVRAVLSPAFRRAIPGIEVDENEALVGGYYGITIAPQHEMPLLLGHLLGRPPEDIGPHSRFFWGGSGMLLIGPSGLRELRDLRGQVDLTGIAHSVHRLAKGKHLEIWQVGASPEISAVPRQILEQIGQLDLIYCEINDPFVARDSLNESVFSRAWNRYMPIDAIPYDLEERESALGSVMGELRSHVFKWQELKRLPTKELLARFHRRGDIRERL